MTETATPPIETEPDKSPETEGQTTAADPTPNLPAVVETALPSTIGPPSAGEWQTIRAIAETPANSTLVPGPLRRRVDDVTLVVLTGRELALPPVMSLSHVHVVEGKPTLSAEMMRALVMRAGHRIRIV